MARMAELLDDAAVSAALADLDGWTREGDAIVRTVELPSFPVAIEVVGRVGEDAEDRDHHPDIDIRWRTLTFRLSTHSAGGLTAKDTELASQIDARIAAAG
jgi:4a-hydroxytetrahydrobiopterin dehydratase